MSVGYGEFMLCFFILPRPMNFTEHIDLKAVAKRGIRLGYTPDVLTDAGMPNLLCDCTSLNSPTVADITVMLVLMAGRNCGIGYSLVQNGGVCG